MPSKTLLLVLLCVPWSAISQSLIPSGFEAWPVPIEKRVFPGSFSRETANRVVRLVGCRNEVVSAQFATRNDRTSRLSYRLSSLHGDHNAEIPIDALQMRYGMYLPVDETAQYTADPLVDLKTQALPANVALPLWLTLRIPRSIRAGRYRGTLTLSADERSLDFSLDLEVLQATLPDAPDYSFYLNLWQDPNGVARAHKVKLWSEEHWRLLSLYGENLADHGEKSIMTAVIHDPWNAQTGYEFPTMVEWKYPGEWKTKEASGFQWDFTLFDRYVNLMITAGVKAKIDIYAMVKGPGPTPDASIRYFDTRAQIYRTEPLKVGDPKWREAWTVFLPALKAHLIEKGWWQIAYLGFDEKPKDLMDQLVEFISRAGPDFKLVMSGGHASEGAGREVVVHWDELGGERWEKELAPIAQKMREKGQLISFYTACEPHFPNLFLYSSLRESRMFPWVAWKYDLSGYTRWAVNAFPDNVFTQPNFKWHSGDMYFLYPGETGPLDGMRFELLRQGIQDYEALRIAHEMASFWGRADLLKMLDGAVAMATMLDSCRDIPLVEEARNIVNEVIRQSGSPDEMGKKSR
jgi:Glycoside hydrolase 123, catalytic domain/Glycoside hydrolase 123 N-terminal domain